MKEYVKSNWGKITLGVVGVSLFLTPQGWDVLITFAEFGKAVSNAL